MYSIKDLEYLSGIKAHTIRIWEKRYHLIEPQRTDTNIRTYSDDDIRRILNVALLVKNGYKISNVASFDEEKLQAEVLRVHRNIKEPDNNVDQLIFQTINLDSFGFEKLMNKFIGEYGFPKTIQNIIFPLFERIGILWQVGSIFSAHEHFVTNLIRNKLISETSKFESKESAKTVLFFLRENEWHELGLIFFNFLAAQAGLRCVYLGQSLPFGDLSNLLINSRFDYVCTSFIQAMEKAELEQYLANLSLVFNRNKILIAGRQITVHSPKLPSNVFVVKNSNDFLKKISG
ncbi:MAG: MerR family transcriptional regulator [Bacteroidia bacterium]|jgi:MerR family transcriptional regulator, light-induced transcriptional regulator